MSKRGNNEGNIRQRADGRWESSVMTAGKRRYFYGTTREAVAKRLTAHLRAVDEGTAIAPSKGTVAEFLTRWLEHLRAEDRVRPRTLAGYEASVRAYISPSLGHLRLDRLTVEDVDSWLKERAAKPRAKKGRGSAGREVKRISAVTMRNALRVLRLALKQALRWRLIAMNPASVEAVDPPRGPSKEARYLNPDEAGRLVEALEGDRMGPLFYTMIATGLRPSEAAGLTWARVDLDRGELDVRVSLEWRKEERAGPDGKPKKVRVPYLAELKTATSRRTLRLTGPAVQVLREHRAAQLRERLLHARAWAQAPLEGLVFTTEKGRPVDPSTMASSFRSVAATAKIEGSTPYSLRHSWASLALAEGISLKVIASGLGHTGVALAGKTYAHVLPQLQAEAAEAVGRVLERKKPAPA